MKILVTGSAGFIGYHLTSTLLKLGHHVIGVDNLNDYYDPNLKESRLKSIENLIAELDCRDHYKFYKIDIADNLKVAELFSKHKFDRVINLAAQAGVRYSLENPRAYVDSNLVGFTNIIEGCRSQNTRHFIYASSSSVYGMNSKTPFATTDCVDHPISLYAATKKSNELIAHTYSHLFGLPATGLRFFTVYGPWGRPDMAYYSFTEKIINGEAIDVFNNGDMMRDFTYIDDIIEGIVRIMDHIPPATKAIGTQAQAPYKIYNIGNNQPITLDRFIKAIEKAADRKAIRNHKPMQAGDVPITYADVQELIDEIAFKPSTDIESGIQEFFNWHKEYKKSKLK